MRSDCGRPIVRQYARKLGQPEAAARRNYVVVANKGWPTKVAPPRQFALIELDVHPA